MRAWVVGGRRLGMCGRYTQTHPEVDLEGFEEFSEIRLEPRYNIAPTQTAPVVAVLDGELEVEEMRFGLVPFWAKDVKVGYKMINARAESVADKPSYRAQFKKKRCLVLADGYYEWKKETGAMGKRPFRFVLGEGRQFAFGGLWDRWQDKGSGETIHSFTIVTTAPNEVAERIHNRMPFILLPERYEQWLDPDFQDTDELREWLKPYPEDDLDAYEVSTLVNSPKNEKPECVEPLERE